MTDHENTERPVAIAIYGRRELRELQSAALERVENLKKISKKAEDSFLVDEANAIRRRLRIWQGEDGEPGILDRINEQISVFDPAFSDNGREPAGQQELFEGREREPEPEVVDEGVPVHVLKAGLIVSLLAGEVGPEAFEKLDGEVPPERKIAFLGRAPIDLLLDLPVLEQAELLRLSLVATSKIESPEVSEDEAESDAEFLDRIATKVAMHGATLAPFYEPWKAWDGTTGDFDLADAANWSEEQWLALTRAQLEEMVDTFVAEASTPEVDPADVERMKKQIEILVHSPATGEDFKFCVDHACKEACEEALAIVAGLDGNAGREKALRKRISILDGEPGAEYDLTEPRLEVLKLLANAGRPIPAARVTDALAPSVHWQVCNYLETHGLAAGDDAGWDVTPRGMALAVALGLAQEDAQEEPEEDASEEPMTEMAGSAETSSLL